MTFRKFATALLMLIPPTLAALALSLQSASSASDNIPRLDDIMSAVQSRHIKLWFAGKRQNWPLAAYEMSRLKDGLADAATLYAGIPVSNVTTMAAPMDAIEKAISVKDAVQFAKGFDQLTSACNACHQDMERGFVTIQVPAASPFSDQQLAPKK